MENNYLKHFIKLRMSETNIISLLTSLLSPTKSIRESSQIEYHHLISTSPLIILVDLISTTSQDLPEPLKILASILLRQSLQPTWHSLDPPSKSSIKKALLSSLLHITSWAVAKNLSLAISDFAIYLLRSDPNENWSNLLTFIFSGLHSNNQYFQGSSLYLTSALLPYFSEVFSKYRDKLHQSFLRTLESSEPEIRAAAVQALAVLISVINTPETIFFLDLLNPLLNASMFIFEHSGSKGESTLTQLRDLAETEPLFFKPQILDCYRFTEGLCRSNVNIGCKCIAIEFFVVLIEKHHTILFDKKDVLIGICSLVMHCYKETISADEEEEIEIDYESGISQLLRRIVDAIGESIVDHILKVFQSVLTEESDWRFCYTGLKCMMVIIPEIYSTEEICILLTMMHSFILSDSVRLKKASCSCVTALCNEFPKDFQRKYHNSIVSIIVKGICDESFLVMAEACRACKVFIDSSESIIANRYVNELIPLIISHSQSKATAIPSLQVIQSFCSSCRLNMQGFYTEILDFCMLLIQYNDPEIKAVAIECMLALRKTISTTEFLQYTPQYILIFKSLQSSEFGTPFTANTLLNAWMTISKHLKSSFTPYLHEIVPSILLHLSSQSTDIEKYLETTMSIIDSTRGGYLPYVNKTSEIILALIENEDCQEYKVLVANLASSLVNVIRESGNSEFYSKIVVYARTFLAAVWKICSQESDLTVLIEMLNSVRMLIEAPGFEFLTAEEVNYMGEIVLKLLENQHVSKYKDSDDVLQSDYLKKIISDILSALLKSHKAYCYGIIDYVYSHIAFKFLNDSSTDSDKTFALIIICDIIECVGNILNTEKIKEISKILAKNACSLSPQLIKVSLYGISALSIHVPGESFVLIAEELLMAIEQSINYCLGSKSAKVKKIKDLAVITVGNIIKFKRPYLKLEILLPWWLNYLPINQYNEKAMEIHDFLADFVINEENHLVESPLVLNLFLQIAFTENCPVNGISKIAKILDMYLEVKTQQELIACIAPNLRGKLARLQLACG